MRLKMQWTLAALLALALTASSLPAQGGGGGGGHSDPAEPGNNLSYPVIWSDGVSKELRGTYGADLFEGPFWFWWGTGVDGSPLSCLGVFLDPSYICDDGSFPPGDAEIVFAQQDDLNTWQAESISLTPGVDGPLYVHWIDWGDNLESVDWTLRSKVRIEVVLIQDLLYPMVGYEMRHLSGWGIDELWGTNTIQFDSYQSTVYSHAARLVVQKLTQDPDEAVVEWNAETARWEGDALEPLVNKPVWVSADGPGLFSAGVNVKGKVIYGYSWNVRSDNDGEGYYRITFSLDGVNYPGDLNTFFDEYTAIVEMAEEASDAPGGGGTAYVAWEHNLTYIDVFIYRKEHGGGPGN